jgi:hypothetical protein
MKKILIILPFLIIAHVLVYAQHIGMTFQEAKKQGISISELDSIYKSAVHVDTSLAVFKTESEQETMFNCYVKLLQDLGKHLTDNNFKWDKPTNCFNRIYFNSDGSIDYFLFNFLGKPEEKPSEAQESEFVKLLNVFIKDYQISLTANAKFAQCSPATYMPK